MVAAPHEGEAAVDVAGGVVPVPVAAMFVVHVYTAPATLPPAYPQVVGHELADVVIL